MPRLKSYRIPTREFTGMGTVAPGQAFMSGILPYLQVAKKEDTSKPLSMALNFMMRQKMSEAQDRRFLLAQQGMENRQQNMFIQQENMRIAREIQNKKDEAGKNVTSFAVNLPTTANKADALMRNIIQGENSKSTDMPNDFMSVLHTIPNVNDIMDLQKGKSLRPDMTTSDSDLLRSITIQDFTQIEDYFKQKWIANDKNPNAEFSTNDLLIQDQSSFLLSKANNIDYGKANSIIKESFSKVRKLKDKILGKK